MYASVHGTWCNTKTFPMTCKHCRDRVFFFHCECGSRVLFDDLGPPWTTHNCQDDASPSPARPSSDEFFKSMQGVTLSIQDKNSGLLTGMTRFSGSVDDGIVQRVKHSETTTRATMAMGPYTGGKRETLLGIVTHASIVSIEDRFDISSGSLAARQVSKALGGLSVWQITIHVDEIASDPDAEDILSYTFWCNPEHLPNSLSAGNIVEATIKPTKLMGICTKWVASAIDAIA